MTCTTRSTNSCASRVPRGLDTRRMRFELRAWAHDSLREHGVTLPASAHRCDTRQGLRTECGRTRRVAEARGELRCNTWILKVPARPQRGAVPRQHHHRRILEGARRPRRDLRGRAQALDGIIRSDRWFTLPGVVAIIVTGVSLATCCTCPLLGTRVDPVVADPVLHLGDHVPVRRGAVAEEAAGQCARRPRRDLGRSGVPQAVARVADLGRGRDCRADSRAVPHGDEAGLTSAGRGSEPQCIAQAPRACNPLSLPRYDRAPCQDFTYRSRRPGRVTSPTSAT